MPAFAHPERPPSGTDVALLFAVDDALLVAVPVMYEAGGSEVATEKSSQSTENWLTVLLVMQAPKFATEMVLEEQKVASELMSGVSGRRRKLHGQGGCSTDRRKFSEV